MTKSMPKNKQQSYQIAYALEPRILYDGVGFAFVDQIETLWNFVTANQEQLKQDLATPPETLEEVTLEAHSWREDAQMEMTAYDQVRQDTDDQNEAVEEVLNEIFPEIQSQINNIENVFEQGDSGLLPVDLDPFNPWTAEEVLDELYFATKTVDDEALLERYTDNLVDLMGRIDKAADTIVLEQNKEIASDELLKQAEDLYTSQRQVAIEESQFDDVLWSLIVNDFQDFTAGLDLGEEGLSEWQNEHQEDLTLGDKFETLTLPDKIENKG